MTRMSVISSDVNVRIGERPTISYFKKVLNKYDQKIECFKSELHGQLNVLE